ncbi:uncharacterized protein [Cicer arietinum]|uniref:Uncharacterized protein LOC101514263 isoform X2 n=1 Tax=Cicer arietinum TaxID=3827 RepID=A0A1S2Z875_CICAR|nr:uncharacterized protein LOC101514263 isoform X2 [Cicer arietinum]
MHVYVATSLDLNWLLGLFGSAEKKKHISDHSSNKVDESWSSLYILLIIVIGFVLLHLHRLRENRDLKYNNNEVAHEEPERSIDESDRDFDRDQQLSLRTDEHGGATARRQAACVFCGNLSSTRCSRCKVARYCSAECQIGHWRLGHRYECFEIEIEEGQERHIHDHGTSMIIVEKHDNENIPNGSDGNGVGMSSNVGMNDGSSSSDVNKSQFGCEECGSPSTTRCSRCKVVRYCSTKCLIKNWRWHKYNCITGDVSSAPTETPNTNVEVLLKHLKEEEENIHSPTPLYLKLHPEETSKLKSPSKASQVTTKDAQVHKIQWEKYLKDELLKSRKEIFLLQSVRDDWKKRANFARERFQSFKEESEQQMSVLRNENESISNAEKKACNMIHSLHERLNQMQIAVQENIAEKRRLEEQLQMVESERAKLKTELQEEHNHAQYLTLESKKNHEIAQIAIKEVEAVRQELLEEREHVQRVKENVNRDVKFAESRAAFAESKLNDLQSKIRPTNYKVPVKTDSFGRPSYMACTICLTNEKDMAFGCGHMTCRDCGSKLSKCPICREQITNHIRLFPG